MNDAKGCFFSKVIVISYLLCTILTKYLSLQCTGRIVGWCVGIKLHFMLFYWKWCTGTSILFQIILLCYIYCLLGISLQNMNIAPTCQPPTQHSFARSLSSISQVYSIFHHHVMLSDHSTFFLQCKPIYFSPLLQIILNNALRVEPVWMGMIYYKWRSLFVGLQSSAV